MLKILGTILIIGSFSAIGISAKQTMLRRVRAISSVIAALEIISSELSYKLTTLPDIIGLLASDSRPAIREIFRDMLRQMKKEDGLSLEYKWMKAFKTSGAEAGLSSEEILLLCDLSSFIGKYDVEQQLKTLSYTKRRLENCLKVSKDEMKSKGNVYRTCSIAAGILLVLILI